MIDSLETGLRPALKKLYTRNGNEARSQISFGPAKGDWTEYQKSVVGILFS